MVTEGVAHFMQLETPMKLLLTFSPSFKSTDHFWWPTTLSTIKQSDCFHHDGLNLYSTSVYKIYVLHIPVLGNYQARSTWPDLLPPISRLESHNLDHGS